MKDNLPELRDIHLPQDVSMFPPAIGWYLVLLFIIICFVFYQLIIKYLKHSRLRYALRFINQADINNPVLFATTCSEVLRRVCIYKYKDAIFLKGKDWEQFLRTNCTYNLNQASFDLLINAPYLNANNHDYTAKNSEEIKLFCQKFVGENL